jgi:hypothetical protein
MQIAPPVRFNFFNRPEVPVREIGTLRLLGVLLTFGGVILVRYG